MVTEVDTRVIPGNGGKVKLSIVPVGRSTHFMVEVCTVDGIPFYSHATESRSEALGLYMHPFACPDVPDVFRAPPEAS